ncbi:T9SS type A sorting domain-containing protein, partial [candidate division WOR-3 bacterium]|nr:T9SS type A sorting domain-containing protein [candidate division WOR-3 bacterium]
SNRFIVYWTDYRNPDGDPEIMTQKYVDGSPVDPNMQINVDLFAYYHQMSWKEGIACNNDLIIFAWMDDRRAKGWDIYGKLTDWDVMSGIEEYPITRKIENKKINVYPNPFFKSINISGGTGKYMIYNVSGRLVRELHNGYWDSKNNMGKEIKNGIYFIRCDGYKSVKIIKMK